jgi:cell division protease FtsH
MPESPKQPHEKKPGGPGPEGGRGPGTTPPPKFTRSLASWVLIVGLLIVLFSMLHDSERGVRQQTWDDFLALVQPNRDAEGTMLGHNVVDRQGEPTGIVELRTDSVHAWVRPEVLGRPAGEEARAIPIFVKIDADHRDRFAAQLEAAGLKTNFDNTSPPWWTGLLFTLLPFLLLFALIWFFIARSMRGAGGGPGGMLGNFGKSRHRIQSKESVEVCFNDVAGIDEAREEVQEIVEFLKNPGKFQRLGGRIPRGVLLVGPPGCGKTLLAKAIAGEADCPFFSISGSDFVEMFVGVGASRVRDLFKQAKENSPCIIFLDEIDAVGRRRGGGFSSGGHDEREQTLNAILVEMDGFEAGDQVIVIAATNRADVLDPALTRPGRFDRQVQVTLPDLVGRRQILDVHARKVKLDPSVDMDRVARGTPMFSGAELAALINEAAILATMAGKDAIDLSDLEEARDKIRYGRARKSRKIEEKERVATAFHESGHAVVQWLLEDADPVHKVTIIPRGQAMGATFSLPEKDRYGFGRKYLEATMRVLCGGRIAEQRKTDDVSSGASMDIKMATQFARHMILEWGMSERLGFVNYAGEDSREMFLPEKDYSDATARVIDEEIRSLIDAAYADAERIIEEHWDTVVAMSEALLKYETLSSADIERIMKGERLDKPTVAELLARETRSRPEPVRETPAASPASDIDDEPAGGMLPSPA